MYIVGFFSVSVFSLLIIKCAKMFTSEHVYVLWVTTDTYVQIIQFYFRRLHIDANLEIRFYFCWLRARVVWEWVGWGGVVWCCLYCWYWYQVVCKGRMRGRGLYFQLLADNYYWGRNINEQAGGNTVCYYF